MRKDIQKIYSLFALNKNLILILNVHFKDCFWYILECRSYLYWQKLQILLFFLILDSLNLNYFNQLSKSIRHKRQPYGLVSERPEASVISRPSESLSHTSLQRTTRLHRESQVNKQHEHDESARKP